MRRAALVSVLLLPFVTQSALSQRAGKAPDQSVYGPISGSEQLPEVPSTLTLAEALRVGVRRNPQSRAAAAGAASAASTYRAAASFNSPTIAVTHAQGTSTSPTLNGREADTFFDVGELLDTSGQKRYQAASAYQQYSAAWYQAQETVLTVEQQIRDAYWALAAARQITRYSLESLQEAQKINNLINEQHLAGASPKVDVVRSGIDVANAKQAYLSAVGAEKNALSAFNMLLGRRATEPITLADALETGAPTEARSLPQLTEVALHARPTVKAATSLAESARYQVAQTKASRYPDLMVDYERSLVVDQSAVLFSVHFPLFDLGSIHHAVKAAQATHKQSTIQRQQVQQQVVQEVTQAVQDLEVAKAQAESYLKDILTPSLKLRDMAQLGYTQGATGILPVLDAESTLRNARTGYINALLAVQKANDELLVALGESATKTPAR